MTSLRDSFEEAPRISTKLNCYFAPYERLCEELRRDAVQRGSKFSLVEFGVLHGGSLHMWRRFFGVDARIIGVDLNPTALEHVESGFEIHIVDQESREDLDDFFALVGPVDCIIDDGAHTNPATVHTLLSSLNALRPGGALVIEDVHTSFLKEFGNPSGTSIFTLCCAIAQDLSEDYVQKTSQLSCFRQIVRSVEFLPSMIVVRIRDVEDPYYPPRSIVNAASEKQAGIRDLRNEMVMVLGSLDAIARQAKALLPGPIVNRLEPLGAKFIDYARQTAIAKSARRRNRILKRDLARSGYRFQR